MSDMQRLVDLDWLRTYTGTVLHHATVGESEDETGFLDVTFDCGRRVVWAYIPGVFTRLEAPRCARCCAVVGLPVGVGSPKNDAECRAVLGIEEVQS